MARPPKSPDERAEHRVTVRFTDEERRRLDWLTVRLRSSDAAVVRDAVNELFQRTSGTSEHPKPSDDG